MEGKYEGSIRGEEEIMTRHHPNPKTKRRLELQH
jgi:hypothetical protein